jgi:hypothetical protein
MQLVGERQIPDTPSSTPQSETLQQTIQRATTPTDQTQLAQEYITRRAWRAAVLGAINVLIAVVAVRLIVLIGVCGGIFLTYLALDQPDWFRIGTLGIYCVGVIFPAVWLAISGRA